MPFIEADVGKEITKIHNRIARLETKVEELTDIKREVSRLNSRIEHLETSVERLAKHTDGINSRLHSFRYVDFIALDGIVRHNVMLRLDRLESLVLTLVGTRS